MAAKTNDDGQAVKSIGILGAIIIGGITYHILNRGGVQAAMAEAPTDWWALLTSAGSAGLLASWLPSIPVIGPWLSAAVSSLGSIAGIGKKIKDAIPPALVTDIMAIVTGGYPTLKEIEKILSDFSQVDSAVIFQLIRDLFHAVNPGPTPVPNPTPTPAPVASMSAPTPDIPVVI